jgi:hypothetical protein
MDRWGRIPRPVRPTLEPLEARDLPSFLPPVSYKVSGYPRQVQAADLNHDGRRDVVTILQNDYLAVLLGDGTGALGMPAYYFPHASDSFQIADVNNDGNADAVVGGNPGGVLLGNGNGTFQAALHFTTGAFSTLEAIADFDHDGTPDIALTYPAGAQPVGILRGNGNGTFQAPVLYGSGPAQGHLRAADLNGDGWADLVLADGPSNTLRVFLNRGDGTFKGPQSVPACNSPGQVEVGDLNKEGRPDVAATCNVGTVGVFLGNGDGTLQPHQDFATGAWPGSIAIADFNRDRKLDIATSSPIQSNPSVSVLLGNGNGSFQAPAAYPVSGAGFGFAAADLTNDRYPDLVVATNVPKTVDVLLNDANWTAPAPPPAPGRSAEDPAPLPLAGAGAVDRAAAALPPPAEGSVARQPGRQAPAPYAPLPARRALADLDALGLDPAPRQPFA